MLQQFFPDLLSLKQRISRNRAASSPLTLRGI
jgi:hypothetical protein